MKAFKLNLTLLSVIIISIISSAFVKTRLVYAQDDIVQFLAKGKYFEIYGYPGINVFSLINQLDYQSVHITQSLAPYAQDQQLSDILAKTLDAIYLEVSDILDLHIYNFVGGLEVFEDAQAVAHVFKKYSGLTMHERSFYFHEKKTIYISEKDLTLGMLGHEIAHAIISHYFAIPPPMKVQEVLAGYVEFHLRRRYGTLPSKERKR
jgi:hypothetical protein